MPKLNKNIFNQSKPRKTPKGNAGYDNPRENIDPNIKTKAINVRDYTNSKYGAFKKIVVGNCSNRVHSVCPSWVYHEHTTDGDNTAQVITLRQTVPTSSPNYVHAIRYEANYYGTTGTLYRIGGLHGRTYVSSSSTGDINGARGITGNVDHRGTGTITSAIGTRSSIALTGGGNITIAANYGASNLAISDGTIGALASFWIESPNVTGTGAITTYYGFYVPEITGPGTSYCFYQAGTQDNVFGGNVQIKNQKELRFYEGANYVGFEAPALTADKIWVLPDADGTANQALKTDGAGSLDWITVPSTYADIKRTSFVNYDAVVLGAILMGAPMANGVTVMNNPFTPRNYTFNVQETSGRNPVTGTITLNGVDCDGAAISEVFTINVPAGLALLYTGVKAFSTVTDFTITNTVGIGMVTCSEGDKIGLPNYPFNATTDVFKVCYGGFEITGGGYVLNATYGTIDMTGLMGAASPFMVWYRPFK